jgi:chaperone required for assembly of F1-ATPase
VMRDIFADIFAEEAADPVEAARRGLRPKLPRRFYARSHIGEGPEGHLVLLDGKPVRTPAGRTLAAPARALAEAIAAEWEAQREVINPALMPLTRLANSIIDGITGAPAPVAAEIAKYLGSDLVCYRAQAPKSLRVRQEQHWNPVLEWARTALDARFVLGEGVMHVAQPQAAIANATKAIPREPWRLGALCSITTLTGSALLALALLHGRLSVEDVWAAAHVDEDWQMEQWGADEVALARSAFRFSELRSAATVLTCLQS